MKTVAGKLSRGLQVRVLPGAPGMACTMCNYGERSSVGRAPDCDSGRRGFESHRSPHLFIGPLAQLAEQGTLNPKVRGSNPRRPTN